MAFTIRKTSGAALAEIESALVRAFGMSRFTGDVVRHDSNITIHNVRLREGKHYCGNHPNACPIRPFVGEKAHKKSKCLEGADWVGFNDMVNDVLDSLSVSANAGSSLCKIRKGLMRRMRYVGHFLGNQIDREWDKDDTRYECYVRKGHPPTDYPSDTPGVAEWRLEDKPNPVDALKEAVKEASKATDKASNAYVEAIQEIANKFRVYIVTGHLSDTWQIGEKWGEFKFIDDKCSRAERGAFNALDKLDESVSDLGIGPSNMEKYEPK